MTIASDNDVTKAMEHIAGFCFVGIFAMPSSDGLRMQLDLLESVWAYRLSRELTAIPIEIEEAEPATNVIAFGRPSKLKLGSGANV